MNRIKRTKRTVAWLLAVVMLFGLAACGGGNDNQQQQADIQVLGKDIV